MTLEYNIKFTDTSKPGIVIKPKEQNNDTSLTLVGRDFEQWGKLYNENIIKILDNWHNDHEPGYPGQVLEGQFWYDQLEDTLKLCVSSDPLEWDPVANNASPALSNYVTQTTYDNMMGNYIQLKGNTKPAGPILVLNDDDPDSLANRKYVETMACACSKNKFAIATDVPFISQQGGPITTQLSVPDNTSDPLFGVTKKYITENTFVGYELHTNESKIFKTITGLAVAPNAIMASTVECGSDFLITISGEFTMADGVGEGKLTLNDAKDIFSHQPPSSNEVDSYYVLVQGAAPNAASLSNPGKMNELYVSKILPPDITIKREDTAGATKGYITIYWTIHSPGARAIIMPPVQPAIISPYPMTTHSGGTNPKTYTFESVVPFSGNVTISYNFFSQTNSMKLYVNDQEVAHTGSQSGSHIKNITVGSTDTLKIEIIGGSGWEYTVSAS